MILSNISKNTKIIDTSNISNLYGCCNHSYVKIDDKEYINFRITNYKYVSNWGFPVSNQYKYFSDNIICEIDKDYNIINSKILTKSGLNYRFNGEEDIRFFRDNGNLKFYSSKSDCNEGVKNTGLNIFTLDKNLKCEKIKENLKYKYDWEKNWSYIDGTNSNFIYTFNPFTIIQLNEDCSIKVIKTNDNIKTNYRCSSNTLKFYDGYLTLIHYAKDLNYYHKFIYFNENFEIIKESKEFTFANKKIEFSCSIIDRGDDIDILFSLYDTLPLVSKFSKDTIYNFIFDNIDDNDNKFIIDTNSLLKSNIFAYISLISSSNENLNDKIYLLKISKELIKLVNGDIIDLMSFRDRIIGVM